MGTGSDKKSFKEKLKVLTTALAILSATYLIVTEIVGWKVSRRMANLPFTLLSSIFCLAMLLAFFLIEYHFTNNRTSAVLFDAVNRNQLAIFLAANLMTGGINLAIDTIGCSDFVAVLILTFYIFLIGLTAVGLDFADITLKF